MPPFSHSEVESKRRDKAMRRSKLGENVLEESELSGKSLSDSDIKQRVSSVVKEAKQVLSHNPISWSSEKQWTVARSSTQYEYHSVAATVAELRWICSLLTGLGIHIPDQPVIYCDNVGARNMCANLFFHSHMKHVALTIN
ncbi:hypothetical protein GQ457_14G023900 [Hibiscus cannabinus]